jgi:hypothetical protein
MNTRRRQRIERGAEGAPVNDGRSPYQTREAELTR